MIPDLKFNSTLYVKDKNGEYQELGKTKCIEYEHAVGSIPTANIELDVTYKEKEVNKDMKTFELNGKEVILEKTKLRVTDNSSHTYELVGIPVYFNKDNACVTMYFKNWSGGHDGCFYEENIPSKYKGTHSCYNVDVCFLQVAEEEPIVEITNDGIKLSNDCMLTTDCLHRCELTVDNSLADEVDSKTIYEKCKEEKEKGEIDNMELIDIFEENLRKDTDAFFEDIKQNTIDNNKYVKAYNSIVDKFKKDLEELYKSQKKEEDIIVGGYIMQAPYQINLNNIAEIDDIRTIDNARLEFFKIVNERLDEIKAQINLIQSSKIDNEYDEIIHILRRYNVLDKDDEIARIDVEAMVRKLMKEAKEEENKTSKRGRKSKKNE